MLKSINEITRKEMDLTIIKIKTSGGTINIIQHVCIYAGKYRAHLIGLTSKKSGLIWAEKLSRKKIGETQSEQRFLSSIWNLHAVMVDGSPIIFGKKINPFGENGFEYQIIGKLRN